MKYTENSLLALDWTVRKIDIDLVATSTPVPTTTPTPTPIVFKKIDKDLIKIDLKPLPTATVTPSPKPTEKIVASPTEKIEEVVSATPTSIEKIENKNMMSQYLTWITIGLLALIIIIQIWPKRKKISDK